MSGGEMAAAVRRKLGAITLPGPAPDAVPCVTWFASDGPVVVITANVHGDEVTGVAAVHALDDAMATKLRRGSVVLVPSLNPTGLVRQQRQQPEDGVDLNRLFPGDPNAPGASGVAGAVWRDLGARRPTALIDLHADSAVSVPYAIVDRATRLKGVARTRMERALIGMAEASRLLVLHEFPETEYVRFRLDRSLAGAMVNHASVPAVTLEIGPRRAVDPVSVRVAVAAVTGVLAHLGLVDEPLPPPTSPPRPGRWRRASAPRVRFAGVFEPLLAPGESFEAAAPLGTVRALDGTVREVVVAECAGLVVSWSETAWVEPRSIPGTLAVEDG